MKSALLLCALVALSAAEREFQLDARSAEDETGVCRPGETVSFKIASNPSTGYMWYFVPSNSMVGELVNGYTGDYTEPSSGLIGASGHQNFRVKCWELARVRDQYSFRLSHQRHWESSGSKVKTVTLVVEA